MEPIKPFEPLNESILRLRTLLEYRLRYRPAGFILFLEFVTSIRLWLAHDTALLADLWDRIRKDEKLMDFTVELTRQFFIVTHDLSLVTKADYGTDTFLEYLANALHGSLSQFVGTESLIDTDTLELLNAAKVETYLQNPWFMVILLADMSCFENLIAPGGIPLVSSEPARDE